MPPERVRSRIFISYSREDKRWLDRVEAHLAPLRQEGIIQPWVDTGEIEHGDRFGDVIAEAIDTSGAAILLVSPHFQKSPFIQENELPRLRRHADAGALKLFWIKVSECRLATKLGGIYHCVNDSVHPLDDMTDGQVNRVLANLALKLEEHVTGIGSVPPPPSAPSPPAVPPGPEAASRERPWVNSLGIPFLPVPGSRGLFARWPVRVRDYAAFAAETVGVDGSWRDVEYQGHKQGPDHPVVNVSWEDARAFCAWLTRKEGRTYRLPTDHERSLAVGIGDRENAKASPKEKDMKIRNVYPWGTQWPPPSGAGNYAGEEAEVFGAGFSVIAGYRDDHPFTSPVGSYRANALGLQDLGGNVWEWVEDTWEPSSSSRVLRGASWGDYDRGGLWSSYRHLGVPTLRGTRIGFRVVLDVGEGER